jgi:hypothetical protein
MRRDAPNEAAELEQAIQDVLRDWQRDLDKAGRAYDVMNHDTLDEMAIRAAAACWRRWGRQPPL